MTKFELLGNLQKYKKTLAHSLEYGKQHYAKIDKYYPDGRARYFWTKAEWDAYQEGLKRTKWEQEQKAKNNNNTQNNKSRKTREEIYDNILKIYNEYDEDTTTGANKVFTEKINETLQDLSDYKRLMSKAKVWLDEHVNSNETEWHWRDSLSNALDYDISMILDEISKRITDDVKKMAFDDYKKDDIYNIIENNLGDYWEDYITGKINKDPYGLKKREQEIEKGQIILNDLHGQNKNADQNKIKNDVNTSLNITELIDKYINDKMSDEEKKAFEENEEEMLKTLDDSLSKIRKEEKKDPKTGLPLKEYNCSIEEDMLLINYHRQLGDESGYVNNCSLCTTAMVLRQKGYDVSASSTNIASPGYDDADHYELNDVFKNDKIDIHEFDNRDVFNNAIKELPIGSYGEFAVQWTGALCGHSMFFKIENDGKFQIYDCQIGQKVDLDEILDISFDWQITRLDDKEMNEWFIRNNKWTKYN